MARDCLTESSRRAQPSNRIRSTHTVQEIFPDEDEWSDAEEIHAPAVLTRIPGRPKRNATPYTRKEEKNPEEPKITLKRDSQNQR